MTPGRTLHRIAAALIPQETRERVIDAQLADFQHEWVDAKSAKARFAVLLRGYGAFWSSLPVCAAGGLRKEATRPVLQAVITLAAVGMIAALIAAAGSWVKTGAISWSDVWSAGTDAHIVPILPWMALVQHYARTKHISIVPMGLALVASVAWRVSYPNPRESFDHWLKGLAIYIVLALLVPRLARAGSGASRT
jgi:hypothetical protein